MFGRKYVEYVVCLSLIVLAGSISVGCLEAQVDVSNLGSMSHTVEFEDNGERTLAPGESYLWTLTWQEDAPGDSGTQIPYYVDGSSCGTYHIWDGETDRTLDIDDGYVELMCSD